MIRERFGFNAECLLIGTTSTFQYKRFQFLPRACGEDGTIFRVFWVHKKGKTKIPYFVVYLPNTGVLGVIWDILDGLAHQRIQRWSGILCFFGRHLWNFWTLKKNHYSVRERTFSLLSLLWKKAAFSLISLVEKKAKSGGGGMRGTFMKHFAGSEWAIPFTPYCFTLFCLIKKFFVINRPVNIISNQVFERIIITSWFL